MPTWTGLGANNNWSTIGNWDTAVPTSATTALFTGVGVSGSKDCTITGGAACSLLSCSEYFLKELKEICQKENIVLIFDEVYSGWSKTGELFYFMNFENLVPDIVTSAKSLGGGKASISAYTCRDIFFKKAYDNLRDATLHSTTFNGFGEETATAIEAINIIIEENYVKKSKEIFNILNTGLINLKDKYPKIIKEVRGSGSLNGIIINTDFTDKYFQPLFNKYA
jgi:putrescine aminotransferase